MRTIAVIGQKGGVGKTTTTVNFGHALALEGHRVALADLDPQGHLSPCLGIFRAPRRGMDEVFLNASPMFEHAVDTRELLQLIPAGERLSEVEELSGGTERARYLGEAIDAVREDIDYLIFDCPPSSGLLVANAVLGVDDVLVPVAGDYLPLTGLARLMITFKRFVSYRVAPLHTYLFMSRYLTRRRLAREVQEKLLQHFPSYLLATAVREAAVIAESAGAGRTVFEYRAHSKSAEEFRYLCRDYLNQRLLVNEQQ